MSLGKLMVVLMCTTLVLNNEATEVQLRAESDVVRCVTPDNTTPCPTSCMSCDTLSNISHDINYFFTSYATIFILPGNHTLDYGITVTDVTRLNIVGGTDPDSSIQESGDPQHASVIHCTELGGLVIGNSSDIVLENISVVSCGQQINFTRSTCEPSHCFAALAFDTVYQLSLLGVHVNNSGGYGVYAERLLGDSNITNSLFSSNFGKAPKHRGGNMVLFQMYCYDNQQSHLVITHSQFLDAFDNYSNPTATGLTIMLECDMFNVTINECLFARNAARSTETKWYIKTSTGANLGIFFRNYTNIVHNYVTVRNSILINGSSHCGAGMYVSVIENIHDERPDDHSTIGSKDYQSPLHLDIINVTVDGNHVWQEGGGIYVVVRQIGHRFKQVGNMVFKNCTIKNNVILPETRGGAALHIDFHNYPDYVEHGTPQYKISFIGCNISYNYLDSKAAFSATGSGAVFIAQGRAYFTECNFEHNNLTAIALAQSTVIFHGNISITGNNGTNGGGMLLCYQSFLYFRSHTNIVFANNHASRSGGAIFAEDQCLGTYQTCFYQAHYSLFRNASKLVETVHLEFSNNTAEVAGSVIYGGSFDNCSVEFAGPHGLHNTKVIDQVFEINYDPKDMSPISSSPQGVCFCRYNETLGKMMPNCQHKQMNVSVNPGERFTVPAVVVGQKSGTVPGMVWSRLKTEGSSESYCEYKYQAFNKSECSLLNYSVFTNKSQEVIILGIWNMDSEGSISRFQFESPEISVSLTPCPAGFTLCNESLQCDCAPTLLRNDIHCNIINRTIERTSQLWIGYNSEQKCVIYCGTCPYGFCKEDKILYIEVTNNGIDEQNSQCTFNRSGILCGKCLQGLSLSLGNSKCVLCSDTYILLVFVFAVAGIILVLFLTLCNITVSEGTLNGIIFYANMVHLDSSKFFYQSQSQPLHSYLSVLQIFVAWLNLDFGIETCFYNGMDAYAKAWLQFVFPVYLWVIAGLIIFFSHKSIVVSRIVGRNAVKVLATLFFLSYAKLLRAIIVAMAPTVLVYGSENGTEYRHLVWGYDGSMAFLSGKHIPLFIAAVAFGLFTLPYSIALTFIQCLQRGSHTRPLFWVRKLKPFFDAYTGPYKDKSRFWAGSLLLLRLVKFLVFAFNVYNSHDLSMFTNVIIVSVVFMIAWLYSGVYKKGLLNTLESVSVMNLAVLSAFALYLHSHHPASVVVVTSTSVTVELLLLLAVLCYHAYAHNPTATVVRGWWLRCIRRQNYVVIPEVTAREGCHTTQERTELLRSNRHEGYFYREPLLGSLSEN